MLLTASMSMTIFLPSILLRSSISFSLSRIIPRPSSGRTFAYATVASTAATMTSVSPNTVHLPVAVKAAFAVPKLKPESAQKTSELLQKNHDEHHIFFNKDGFHVRNPEPTSISSQISEDLLGESVDHPDYANDHDRITLLITSSHSTPSVLHLPSSRSATTTTMPINAL